MTATLIHETIWFDKFKYEEAESNYQIHVAKQHSGLVVKGRKISAEEILSEEEEMTSKLVERINALELENQDLKKATSTLQHAVAKLEARLKTLEVSDTADAKTTQADKPKEDDDNDEEIDLFASDDEDEAAEVERVKAARVAEYEQKKAKKNALIAKSNIILDVKPWDDETDMADVEKVVRSVVADGLVWGQGKLVPVGYGIKKLQISCVVEDDKIGTDYLEEEITKFEDLVQSVDVAAFNKL